MAELIIRLEVDPRTRKKNVIISYRSDEDSMPMEHEEDHRNLVNQLIEGGALNAAELGQIVIEREGGGQADSEEPRAAQERGRRSIEQER